MAAIDLRAKKLDLLIGVGDTWSLNLVVKDPSGQPTNLVNHSIVAQVVPTGGSPVGLTVSATHAQLEVGLFYIGQESALTAGSYTVHITDLNGAGRTYLKGSIILS